MTRRIVVWLAVLAIAMASNLLPFAGRAGAAMALARTHAPLGAGGGSSTWRDAVPIPGLATLNAGDHAGVVSVSCTGASCSAAGSYLDASGANQAFVVNEADQSWGQAEEVPGSASLNEGGNGRLNSVSCASPVNCSAGGTYSDGHHDGQAFVVDESGGVWGRAVELPGSAALNAGGQAEVNSISCASPGNCSAGGAYRDGSGHGQAFVATESGGGWGSAVEVPGSGQLNGDGEAEVNSISCVGSGYCTAGGTYRDSSSHYQAFVVNEVDGVWGEAAEVPGTATLNAGGDAYVASVSCTAVGECTAGGDYFDHSEDSQVFVASETDNAWGAAEEVPGSAALNVDGGAELASISCASTGNCAAGGLYDDASGAYEAYVVNETDGRWGNAEEVPGSGDLNVAGFAELDSVSCAAAGACSAGGSYSNAAGDSQAFVVDETKGSWGTARELPGSANLNIGNQAAVTTISCTALGTCTSGGSYDVTASDQEALVASYAPAPPTVTRLVNPSGPVAGGNVVTIDGTNLSGATSVEFGKKAATHLTAVGASVLKVTAPPGTGGVNVTVTTPGGTSALSKTARYTYLDVPTVRRLSPTSGPAAGGGVVTVTGSHLRGVTSVMFGTWAGSNIVDVTSGSFEVTVPAGHGKVNVTVTTPGGRSVASAGSAYTYVAKPKVTSLSPKTGPSAGGNRITVSGTNFTPATTVQFGTEAGTKVTVTSAESLTVTAPPGSGTVDVTVTTVGGTSAISGNARYQYQ